MKKELTCRLLLLAAVATVAAGCVAKPGNEPTEVADVQSATPPAELTDDVRRAETWGRTIYDNYRVERPPESDAVRTAIETTRASVRDDCAPDYRTVVVAPAGAPSDRIFLYYIGEVPDSQGMMLGRHYRIETSIDGKGIMLGEPSMANCLILPPTTDTTAQALITHTVPQTPDEFDVFLSLRYNRPLLVATAAGSWRVENGKITYLGRR